MKHAVALLTTSSTQENGDRKIQAPGTSREGGDGAWRSIRKEDKRLKKS